jgi:hypothetical protein
VTAVFLPVKRAVIWHNLVIVYLIVFTGVLETNTSEIVWKYYLVGGHRVRAVARAALWMVVRAVLMRPVCSR